MLDKLSDLRLWGAFAALVIAGLYWLLKPAGDRLGVWILPAILALAVVTDVGCRLYRRRERERKARDCDETEK